MGRDVERRHRLFRRKSRSTRKGRYRSGQTGQTVNLLALRLPRFESLPAHHIKTAPQELFLCCRVESADGGLTFFGVKKS